MKTVQIMDVPDNLHSPTLAVMPSMRPTSPQIDLELREKWLQVELSLLPLLFLSSSKTDFIEYKRKRKLKEKLSLIM